MKREAYRHPKMLDLSARLGVDRARAIGTVTLLLDFTADMAPRGDVGKWPDGAIARACEWGTQPQDASFSAADFVRVLVESKWLDEHPEARLLVHDWPDHCERFVKSKLASLGQSFHPAYLIAPSPDVSPDTSLDPPRDQTKPNQTKPTPTKPNQTRAVAVEFSWDEESQKSIIDALKAVGFARAAQLATESQTLGLAPEDVLAIVVDFKANRSKLTSPGAIAERIRHGVWPANGVLSAGEVETEKAAKERRRARKRRGMEILKVGARSGKADAEIEKDLAAEGLTWEDTKI